MDRKTTTLRIIAFTLLSIGLSGNAMAAEQFELLASDAEVYGTRAIERGEYAEAADKLGLALELAGNAHMMRAPVLNNLCVAYTMQQKLDQAAAYCDEYVANGRELSIAYNNRGVVSAAIGDFASAVANFEASLDENPADAVARKNLRLAQQRLASVGGNSEKLAGTSDDSQPKG
jgi:tetratricopeptide (TPR) repeat protein